MRKVLAILTEDFRLYHDLVAALKARDLPFASLSFARRVPESVGAILTSPAEAAKIRFPHVVRVDDIDASIAKALQLLKGKAAWRELWIGVDPGREPGVAIIGDGDDPSEPPAGRRRGDRDRPDAGPAGRPPVRDSPDAGGGPRDSAALPPRKRRRRDDFLRAGRGRGPRRTHPRGSDRPRAAEGRPITGLGCSAPRAPCGV